MLMKTKSWAQSKNTQKNKLYKWFQVELNYVILSMSAAKSKFLKKEKFYVNIRKLESQIWYRSLTISIMMKFDI